MLVFLVQYPSISLSMGASLTAGFEVGVEGGIGGIKTTAKTSFSATLSTSASFTFGKTVSTQKSFVDVSRVQVTVPAGKKYQLTFFSSKQDVVYKWKADLILQGKFTIERDGGKHVDAIDSVLTNEQKRLYAFGRWEFPNQEIITARVIDQSDDSVVETHDKKVEEPKSLW